MANPASPGTGRPERGSRKPTGRGKRARTKAELTLRREVVATALEMSRTGLSPGRSGNVSARFGDGMLITPSGMPYDEIAPDDIVAVGFDDAVAPGQRKPSSEWRFHLETYRRRPTCAAIVHVHSCHATALACAHKPIPAFHYMVAVAGGADIPLVPYAPFGTQALADHVATGLSDRNACLMANHGQIAIGSSLAAALELAAEIETLAQQYIMVLGLGPPNLLGSEQMAEVLARFTTYGQNAQPPNDVIRPEPERARKTVDVTRPASKSQRAQKRRPRP